MPDPPELAQLLLNALLPVDTRESVSGDLLEEYRDSRVPAAGEFRADVWYWRQVGGVWLRAYWWLVVPAVLLFVVGDVFNTFRRLSGASYLDALPPLARAAMSPSPLGLVALLGIASACGSWRTRRWQGGLAAALGLSAAVWVFMGVWWNATFYWVAHVQQSDPYWIQAWHWSVQHHHAPRDETFLVWLYWDNIGGLLAAGVVLFLAPCVYDGISATVSEVISHVAGSRLRSK